MGRPALPTEDRRTIQLKVRVNVAESLKFDHAAAVAGISVPEFLRRSGLNRPTLPTRRDVDRLAAMALIGLGNNLNQLTRHANSGRGLPARGSLEALLADIQHHLDQLFDPGHQQRRPDL